jgi:hypothetical protein
MKWYSHACPCCGGDLHDDIEDRGWVTCMMCARSFVAKDVLAVQATRCRDLHAVPVVSSDVERAA